MDDDSPMDYGSPLDDAEEQAFEELRGELGMDDVPPSEQEARAYLGDTAYEEMAAFNRAANALTILKNGAVVDLTRSKARMWNALAFFLRLGTVAAAACAIKKAFF